jgi:hypothetical protein
MLHRVKSGGEMAAALKMVGFRLLDAGSDPRLKTMARSDVERIALAILRQCAEEIRTK